MSIVPLRLPSGNVVILGNQNSLAVRELYYIIGYNYNPQMYSLVLIQFFIIICSYWNPGIRCIVACFPGNLRCLDLLAGSEEVLVTVVANRFPKRLAMLNVLVKFFCYTCQLNNSPSSNSP